MTESQILTVVILAVILLLVVPVYRSRTGKNISEILIGRGSADSGSETRNKREPHLKNGTAGDLRYFLSSLIALAARKKMKVVTPGTVVCNGETANVTAYLVTASRILCIHCLGFNGEIKPPADGEGEWIQHMNGKDVRFEGPPAKERHNIAVLAPAFESIGVNAPLEFVAVFTTDGVKLNPSVMEYENVFIRNRFLDYVKKNAEEFSHGNVDVDATARKIADLVGIDRMREEAKKAKKNKK